MKKQRAELENQQVTSYTGKSGQRKPSQKPRYKAESFIGQKPPMCRGNLGENSL